RSPFLASIPPPPLLSLFCSTAPAPTQPSPLSLHDALPISLRPPRGVGGQPRGLARGPSGRLAGRRAWLADLLVLALGRPRRRHRSEEHTSELQSLTNLVCRLLLEKKKNKHVTHDRQHNIST